ncbi:acetolactate synthase [Intrasporangium chromatireducens Q5-1]|uniref:Acetolactate synthase n=1 Tax=Intrasporangium chromatireducens Q5-1 TaxID=584657 RepID=W9GNZ3_9MICO|nr:thiamine pyrophosphate-binding protein [Intrasporangium chromatireducens]EWT06518.1 acetolactate synthase [Intrasporangium chromatireducens Q5-1]
MSPTGGHAVVSALVDAGVEVVFGIPGTHNLEIYRALAESGIRVVTPRHEQGAGYAADAYARVSGKPGVVITTTGPGLTNVTTAAATAYADSIPMLVLSPGMPRNMAPGSDVGWLHEMKDQQGHLDAALERSVRVQSGDEAREAITDTFTRWQSGRCRPVHIEAPVDVLDEPWERGDGDRTTGDSHSAEALNRLVPCAEDLRAAAQVLAEAASVLVIAGGGARHAASELRSVAEALDAPVLTSTSGKGVLPENHELSLGAAIRLTEAHRLIAEVDALLVVGAVLGDDELWGHQLQARGAVVRIDVEAAQLHKNLAATHPLHGDAAATLSALGDALPATVAGSLGRCAPELRKTLDEQAMRDGAVYAPYHEALARVLPPATIIAGDSAQACYFGTVHQWPAMRPGQFLYPSGFATLGYGIPAGIGGALAAPDTPVVVISGDGGVMFTIQEFATAADLGLPLTVIVMNNSGFQEIREEMQARGIAQLGVDVRSPNFPLLAEALGGHGVRVASPDELAAEVSRALQRPGPTLIEVPIDSSLPPASAAEGGSAS